MQSTLTRLLRGAAMGMLWGAALAAQAQTQTLEITCPADAQAGDPATAVSFTTAPGWDIRYGTDGAWRPAYTTYRHPSWRNPPAGNWLTPGLPTPWIPSALPFFYRSPVIQVGARVDPASIVTTLQQSTDNYYNATGIINSAAPDGAMTPYTSQQTSFAALSAAFTPALAWVAGGNQLLLQARNAEANHTPGTPTGVYATITLTATCLAPPAAAVQPVPVNHPWALLLAGLGLATLAARRLRRG